MPGKPNQGISEPHICPACVAFGTSTYLYLSEEPMESVAWQLKSQLRAVIPVLPRLISWQKANEICPAVFDRQQTLLTGNRALSALNRGKPHRWSFTVRLYGTLHIQRFLMPWPPFALKKITGHFIRVQVLPLEYYAICQGF